jgi:hypothetical protein
MQAPRCGRGKSAAKRLFSGPDWSILHLCWGMIPAAGSNMAAERSASMVPSSPSLATERLASMSVDVA